MKKLIGGTADVLAQATATAQPLAPAFPLSPAAIEKFATRSPALGGILRCGEMTRIVTAYDREDQRAINAQRRFISCATHLNASVLATAGTGALILALGVLQSSLGNATGPQAIAVVLTMLGFGGLVVGGYAAARLYEVNAGDLLGDWMRSRARAEKLRSEYFERIVARAARDDTTAQSAAFDLVVSHLLEDQLDYFGRRGKRHEAAAGKWLRWSAFATGLATVGVAAGGMAGAAGQSAMLVIAALGGIGGAAAAFSTAQEGIGQERERAQRFQNNVDALETLARQIDNAREAIAAGSSDVLVTFTGAINQQLALELGRFLESGEGIRASITKLGEEIDKARNSP